MTHREDIRTAAVWCPDWPAVAAARTERIGPERPLAVLGHRGVLACNAPARAAGVRRGLRRRDAQFRCPELVVVDADPSRDAAQFEQVARALDAAVAGTELLRPGLVVLAAPGALRFHGGVDALVEALVGAVAEVDVECLVGIADELPTACLAAREGVCLPRGRDAAYLADLPLRMLAAEPALLAGPELEELLDLLRRLGVRTLGAFAEFTPRDVATRFGALGTTAHRIARGERWRLPSVSEPPPGLEVAETCEPPLERVDQAAFVGRRLAVRLHEGLATKGVACVRLAVVACLADGREVRRVWRCAEPLSAEATADRVRWQLDGWITGGALAAQHTGRAGRAGHASPPQEVSPFDDTTCGDSGSAIASLALEPLEVLPAGRLQEGLWGSAGLCDGRARRALQRVQGLLGTEAVQVAALSGGRAPAQQVCTVAFGEAFRENAATVDPPGASTRGVAAGLGVPEFSWPGALTGPVPAVVTPPPSYRLRVDLGGERRLVPLNTGLELLDGAGTAVCAGERGLLSAAPVRLRVGGAAGVGLPVEGWSAPWPVDEGWWRGGARDGESRGGDGVGASGGLRMRMQVAPVGAAALLLSAAAGATVWDVEGVYE